MPGQGWREPAVSVPPLWDDKPLQGGPGRAALAQQWCDQVCGRVLHLAGGRARLLPAQLAHTGEPSGVRHMHVMWLWGPFVHALASRMPDCQLQSVNADIRECVHAWVMLRISNWWPNFCCRTYHKFSCDYAPLMGCIVCAGPAAMGTANSDEACGRPARVQEHAAARAGHHRRPHLGRHAAPAQHHRCPTSQAAPTSRTSGFKLICGLDSIVATSLADLTSSYLQLLLECSQGNWL